MIVDCHTHLWRYPGELSDQLVEEMAIARGRAFDPNVTPDQHRQAVGQVDRAIVFGLRAPHTGFLCANETVAEYVKTDPSTLIGFGSVWSIEDISYRFGDLRSHGHFRHVGLGVSLKMELTSL